LLKLAHCNGHHVVVDSIVLILADFSGSLKQPVADSIIKLLQLDKKIQVMLDPSPVVKTANKFLSSLVMSVSARAALCTLLQVVHNNPTYISQSWPTVWYALSQMRDCSLLPLEMVSESDSDLLPTRARLDFELRLLKAINGNKTTQATSKVKVKKATSLLSFGDFFFGSSQTDEDESDRLPAALVVKRSDVKRWDTGYEEFESVATEKSKPSDSTESSSADDPDVALRMAMKNLR
jgi:hypothetical protein